ncbi:phytoene desaturase family protein [Ureibacillus manganicus]|uniref:Amine oxidase domain-containing protein n=1 Tax=Ureibacillus manganicus DSM 26584 TaxID=1384049 RepID=A0A0A3IX62_9BACL|nr:FAD-dependent oxidoreductase [Ureibacillus manganicus]KGR79412.1 hypothetical protein CD29_06885 [Ureibacillus manganicus DSM 26584]
MAKQWDVVIIGGGLSGLVGANCLTQSQLSVLVIEKGKKFGGRARTDSINNQLFNIGPHALYKKGEAKSILEQLGIELHGKSPKLGGLLIDEKVKYSAPFNPIGVFTTCFFNWKERMQWIKALVKILNTKTDSISQQSFLQWVEGVSSSKSVQTVLLSLGRLATYCHAPAHVSAKVIVTQLKAVMSGVIYLDGGWQSMIDQLYNKALMKGTEVRSHQTVKQILPMFSEKDTAFDITLANGESISTRNIISTTGPRELLKMLGEYAPSVMKDFFAQMEPVKGATLDVALTKLPDPSKLFALGIHAPLYYSVHSTYAQLSEHSNNVILHVYKYLQPDELVEAKSVQLELEQFLETIQPGWKQYEITSRFIPYITVNERLPLVGDELRLESSKPAVPGLYLSGDWTSPYSILSEAAVSSAQQAAIGIIQKEKS